ncbi:hypothetical protein [Nostoc sp. FACHB-190]|uniref:hypothetical protein n=1 Tax=Nostoc sp. FACHB-190 TaxID=2692838 RepID=UPI0016856C4A|nr:hypothetical protein [Nostoc sp. FACHB-190]
MEDLRKDNIGQIYAWFPKKGDNESSRLLITYPYYSIKAFYFSCQNLEQLEHSKNIINQGNVSISAVGFWFLAIEAFINTLLKIACFLVNRDFKKLRGKDINGRISAIFDILQIEKNEFQRSGIVPKLEEFKTFRNEIFHDRFFDSEVQFYKTSFSSIPYMANQVDVLQASIIALEIFQAFRFVYPGCDLMPDIFIQKNTSFGFIKYDLLYKEVMLPLFYEALNKHSLDTNLATEPLEIRLPESSILQKGDVEIQIRADHQENLVYSANNTETNIGATLFDKVRDYIKINEEETFPPPKY